MTINRKDLDQQINVFLALCGHAHQMVDWWQVMRKMMEEINYWRMVAKHPGEVDRPRGGQKQPQPLKPHGSHNHRTVYRQTYPSFYNKFGQLLEP